MLLCALFSRSGEHSVGVITCSVGRTLGDNEIFNARDRIRWGAVTSHGLFNIE